VARPGSGGDARHAALVAALRARLAAGGRPVEHHATHISDVLVRGDEAWKLKRPVAFGFLDHRTLEARRAACLQEVALNRRFAPQLYLGVLPVLGTPEAPVLGASHLVEGGAADGSAALEYAVHMRAFGQHQLCSQMQARSEFGPRHADALADWLAAFHAQAPRARPDAGYGGSAALRPARDNVTELRAALARPGAGPVRAAATGRLERLAAWLEARAPAFGQRLEARLAAGAVRELHGDLHLGNIVWLDERPVPFDCIEFDAGLRWIDCASELAFLAMDLGARGRPELAARLVNRYLESSGDYEAAGVLALFTVYRAMVRAKVAALHALRPELGRGERAAQWRECAAYLRRAEHEAVERPAVLALACGLSGSGKTHDSAALIERAAARGRLVLRIRSDVERKRLAGLAPSARAGAAPGAGLYAPHVTARTYARLLDLAAALLAAGQAVLVDATLLRRADRDAYAALAERLSARLIVLWFEAERDTLLARLAARSAAGRDASDADAAVLARQIERAEPVAAGEPGVRLRVRAERPRTLETAARRFAALVTGRAGPGRRAGATSKTGP
jgi:aminoglycoside phosphotransferase family enzyme/predicted kinase